MHGLQAGRLHARWLRLGNEPGLAEGTCGACGMCGALNVCPAGCGARPCCLAGWSPDKIIRRAGFAFFGVYGTEANPEFVEEASWRLAGWLAGPFKGLWPRGRVCRWAHLAQQLALGPPPPGQRSRWACASHAQRAPLAVVVLRRWLRRLPRRTAASSWCATSAAAWTRRVRWGGSRGCAGVCLRSVLVPPPAAADVLC